MGYVFEFHIDRGEPDPCTRVSLFGGRSYANDRRAISGAVIMFRNRTTDANDELWVYQGRVNGWGAIDDGARLVGKVAYNQLGTGFSFIKAQ